MKKKVIKISEEVLGSHGFTRTAEPAGRGAPAWFVHQNMEGGVLACLRIDYAPRLRAVSVGLGWRHEGAHQFCIEALGKAWPRGFDWLNNSGVLGFPCLMSFNLGDFMGWSASTLPVDSEFTGALEYELSRLCAQGHDRRWYSLSVQNLLEIYVKDQRPFHWRASNSALRLGEIAGLCSVLRSGDQLFEDSAARHEALIQSDMFQMGNAVSWISSIRAMINSA